MLESELLPQEVPCWCKTPSAGATSRGARSLLRRPRSTNLSVEPPEEPPSQLVYISSVVRSVTTNPTTQARPERPVLSPEHFLPLFTAFLPYADFQGVVRGLALYV